MKYLSVFILHQNCRSLNYRLIIIGEVETERIVENIYDYLLVFCFILNSVMIIVISGEEEERLGIFDQFCFYRQLWRQYFL
jgi:hypothetical protein